MTQQELKKYLTEFEETLDAKKCLKSEWLCEAIYKVPRHLFIEQYFDGERFRSVNQKEPTNEQLKIFYSDRGIMIRKPPNHSAASQPSLVIKMLEDLEVKSGLKVLEIGTGSGWNAGLLAYGVETDFLVHSVDIQSDLVDKAKAHLSAAYTPKVYLKASDGGLGWADKAPFDRIIVTVGCPDIPPAWCKQLSNKGKLLVPFKIQGIGDPLLQLQKDGNKMTGQFTGWSGFMTLQGAFWSDSEDVLEPPWDPMVEKLLAEVPKEMQIPASLSVNALFFLYLCGKRYRLLLDHDRKIGYTPTFFDPETHSIIVSDYQEAPWVESSRQSEKATVKLYGNLKAIKPINDALEKWIDLKMPNITDYKIEAMDSIASITDSDTWAMSRPNITLKFSL